MSRQAADYGLVFEEPPAPLRIVRDPAMDEARPIERRQPSTYIAPDSHRAHGTYVKYVVEKCRCPACRKANCDYENRRQHAIARPDEVWIPYVPAGRARRHVLELQRQGVGIKTIAKLSGVPHGSLSRLMFGDSVRRTPPSKRIRPETERRILAVKLDDASGAQKIPAGPTWELLDDLIVRNYPKAWIARALGKKQPSLQIQRDLVRASTARAVEQLHRSVEGKPGPGRRSRWDSR